jgi:hypothetical protein
MIIWNQIISIKSIKEKMEARTLNLWLMGSIRSNDAYAEKPKRKYVLVYIAASLWFTILSSLFNQNETKLIKNLPLW